MNNVIQNIPEIYQNLYCRAMSGKSLRSAINAKCLDCHCWQRTEVRDCPAADCSLYPYRPYQKGSSKKNRPLTGALSDSGGNGNV